MLIYHMRCPENGDTQRQAVEPGKPLRYLKLLCSEAMRFEDLVPSERLEPHPLIPWGARPSVTPTAPWG